MGLTEDDLAVLLQLWPVLRLQVGLKLAAWQCESRMVRVPCSWAFEGAEAQQPVVRLSQTEDAMMLGQACTCGEKLSCILRRRLDCILDADAKRRYSVLVYVP